jgi:lysophospholipase L1-like esterase
MTVFDIAILGDSLIKDRNARNWPIMLEDYLQVGKSERVRTYLFGEEGTNTNTGLTQYTPMVGLRPRVAVIAYINDANSAAISLATSLSNHNTIIDDLQANSPSTAIYVASISRPTAAAAAASFPNIVALQTQLASIVSAQGIAGFINGYSAWGDPALNPSEYDVGDGIHPLLAGHLRVTLPLWSSVFTPLIT